MHVCVYVLLTSVCVHFIPQHFRIGQSGGSGCRTTYYLCDYVLCVYGALQSKGIIIDYDPTLEKHLPRLLAVVVMQDLDRMIDIIVRSSSSTP